MTNAIIIKSDKVITSRPAGCPNIHDLDSRLVLMGRASDAIGFSDGEQINSFVAQGAGSLEWRTFNKRYSASWEYARLKENATPSGKPSFYFNGGATFANSDGTTGSPESLTPLISSPVTLAYAIKVNGLPYSNDNARILSSHFSSAPTIRPSSTAEQLRIVNASPSSVPFDFPSDEWETLFVVFNGASSLVAVGDTVTPLNLSATPFTLGSLRIGARAIATPDGALVGEIAEFRLYNAALTADEIASIRNFMRVDYGI